MKLISWDEWLDSHIPYYESKKHRGRFYDNPPATVLIIYPYDTVRNKQIVVRTARRWEDWDTVTNFIIDNAKSKVSPLFLETDTNQQWYWAFWNESDALAVVIKLT
jgi:hypothetical protein